MPRSKLSKREQKHLDSIWTAFNDHFSSQYGKDRWHDTLYPALEAPQQYVALMNSFASPLLFEAVLSEAGIPKTSLQTIRLPTIGPNQASHPELFRLRATDADNVNNGLFPAPSRAMLSDPKPELLTHWNMDLASALAVHVLDVQSGDKVLDLCAAPGGKSIALAQYIWWESHGSVSRQSSAISSGCLHINEFDSSRNKALATNIKMYFPHSLIANGSIKLTKIDGTDIAMMQKMSIPEAGYDRVLVDAPCSAERHVIHAHHKSTATGNAGEELMNWRPGPHKSLTRTQADLLMNALRITRVGGRVVYATCSINKTENDGVVEKCLQNLAKSNEKPDSYWSVRLESGNLVASKFSKSWDELTTFTNYGGMVLPDSSLNRGWGPLYFSVMTKTSL